VKGQAIRVLDVFVIGPAMVLGGSVIYKHAEAGDRRALGAFLIAAGIGTSIYNGNNWLKVEAARESAAAEKQSKPQPSAEVAVTAT